MTAWTWGESSLSIWCNTQSIRGFDVGKGKAQSKNSKPEQGGNSPCLPMPIFKKKTKLFWSLYRNRNLFATKDDPTTPLLESGHGLLFPDSMFGPKAVSPIFEVLGL